MYSIILAFRVLEAKIGYPGPIAPPAAEDGSGWRRLRGCDASGRADFGRPFGNRTGTSGYRHPGGKQAEEFRYAAVLPELPHPGGWHPLRPQRYHGADGPRQFGDSAADERIGVKNPSRAGLRGEEDVRTRIPSAPAPLRHRDSAPEVPPPRSFAARAALPYPIPSIDLRGIHSSERRPVSPPLSRETSDLPPGIGISIGPPILTSTKQRTSKTTQQHDCTTTKQQNSTTRKQKTMTSVSTEVSQSVLKSVSTDVNQSVFLNKTPSGPSFFDRFCSRCRLRERAVRLFRLAGEQAGTERDIRPVSEGGGGGNMICFGPGKLCFPLREIFSVTQNNLPARGGEKKNLL